MILVDDINKEVVQDFHKLYKFYENIYPSLSVREEMKTYSVRNMVFSIERERG